MKKLLIKIFFVLPLILALKCGDDVPPNALNSTNFMIVNSDFESLVGKGVGLPDWPVNRYHPDSLKIFDTFGREVNTSFNTSELDLCSTVIRLGLGRAGIHNKSKFELTYFLYYDTLNVDTILIEGTGQLADKIYLNGSPSVNAPPTMQTRTSHYLVK
jgi:hypothetical protein